MQCRELQRNAEDFLAANPSQNSVTVSDGGMSVTGTRTGRFTAESSNVVPEAESSSTPDERSAIEISATCYMRRTTVTIPSNTNTNSRLTHKPGTVDPREYDWKWQFAELDPSAGYIPMDAGKVYGLALYIQELEDRLAKLEEPGLSDEGARSSTPAPETTTVPESGKTGRIPRLGIGAKSGTKEYAREYYRLNKDKFREAQRKYIAKNRERLAAFNLSSADKNKKGEDK